MDSQGLISTQAPNTEIIFGNGHSTVTDKKTTIGDVEALICEDGILQEDLLSVNPLLDIGFKLTMNKSSDLLHNEETGATIHVQREGKRWAVDLEDLASAMKANPDLIENPAMDELVKANAVVHRDPKSIRDQVIQLHERMGHPNTEAMCAAVEGDTPTWTHSNMDTLQPKSKSDQEHHEKVPLHHLPSRQAPETTSGESIRRKKRHEARRMHFRRHSANHSAGSRWIHDVLPLRRRSYRFHDGFHREGEEQLSYRFPQGSRNTQTTWT